MCSLILCVRVDLPRSGAIELRRTVGEGMKFSVADSSGQPLFLPWLDLTSVIVDPRVDCTVEVCCPLPQYSF